MEINEKEVMELVFVGAAVKVAFDTTDNLGALMSAIGSGLDFWAAERGYGAEDVERALRALLSAATDAHRVIGMPEKEETDEAVL